MLASSVPPVRNVAGIATTPHLARVAVVVAYGTVGGAALLQHLPQGHERRDRALAERRRAQRHEALHSEAAAQHCAQLRRLRGLHKVKDALLWR